jgi:uncharacterized membrane protein YfhO
VSIIDWSAEHKLFTLEPGQQTQVRLKIYYYPYWVATANETRLTTKPDVDGALLISVPADKTTIAVNFTEPPSTYIAAAVSLTALLLIILLSVLGPRPGGLKFYPR